MGDFRTSDIELVKIQSEPLESMAQYCIGRWFDRCQKALTVKKEIEQRCEDENREPTFDEHLDSETFWRKCSNMWFGLKGLTRLSIACEDAHHFAVVLQNEKSFIATYIEENLGFNPILDKKGFGF